MALRQIYLLRPRRNEEPNAFALSGGIVMMSQELVELFSRPMGRARRRIWFWRNSSGRGVAGGAPDGCDFAPRESGQAVAPTGGRGPTAQEWVRVEPFGRIFEAEVGSGAGPAVALSGLSQASADGV